MQHHMWIDGGLIAVTNVIEENSSNQEILALGCQALCISVCIMGAARYVKQTKLIVVIVTVSKKKIIVWQI